MKESALPQGCTNLKIRQLGRMVTRHYDQYMAAVGLKNTQYALLSHVVKLGPIRPGDLARRMHMDASTLTRNLQPMVSHGWLTIGAGENARSRLVETTDAVLDALNTATTAFDQVSKAQSERLMKELASIVASIQTVAREAKVVSFNAQVMAARAGQHGREFAVVANVLSGITHEIDGLSLQAVSLAGRSRGAA